MRIAGEFSGFGFRVSGSPAYGNYHVYQQARTPVVSCKLGEVPKGIHRLL